jgi:DNA-binding ferritin-like protein
MFSGWDPKDFIALASAMISFLGLLMVIRTFNSNKKANLEARNKDTFNQLLKLLMERKSEISKECYKEITSKYDEMINYEELNNQIYDLVFLQRTYKHYHNELGPYFKVLHRIIKFLNMELENKRMSAEQYLFYIGWLRSQLNIDDFKLILLNSVYIPRGTGMGIELMGTGLFGDRYDLSISQHFELSKSTKSTVEKYFTYSFRENIHNETKNPKQVKLSLFIYDALISVGGVSFFMVDIFSIFEYTSLLLNIKSDFKKYRYKTWIEYKNKLNDEVNLKKEESNIFFYDLINKKHSEHMKKVEN